MNTNDSKPITLTVDGYEASNVEERVARLLADRADKEMTEKIDKAISSAVESTLRRLVEEKLRPEVERVVAAGWQQTNQWGEPTGQAVTLGQRVSQIINGKGAYDRGTMVENLAREALDKALKGELAPEIAAARDKFRALVDETLKAKFTGVMRDALGLKP